jgi:hypothetical protein
VLNIPAIFLNTLFKNNGMIKRFFKLMVICNIGLLTLINCNFFSKQKPLFNGIPRHELFVNKNTIWVDFNEIEDYRKKLSKNENDTMIILTSDKMILVTGQYGWLPNDTIIMPTSGEFGIHYEVLENTKYKLSVDTLITFGQQQFIRMPIADFQWWTEIIPNIKGLGKGSVIVSGP